MELVDLYDENRVPLGRTAERYGKKGTRRVPGGGPRVRIRPPGASADPTADAGEDSLAGPVGCVHRGGVDAGETSRRPRSGSSGRNWDIPWTLREAGPL